MSFNVIIQYERTGSKRTQKPSDVVRTETYGEALDAADQVSAFDVERVTIERV